ncbi:MAG: copper homeostasis periplasmic binding protein CopC [Hyphomicrobium sp.]
MRQCLVLIFAAAFACAGMSLTASAHGALASSTPASGSEQASAPTALQLKFSESLELKFSGVTLTGPDKKSVATGPAALVPGSDHSLDVPITGTMPAGKYAVHWHVLSKDGHKTKGTYTFTVKP